MRWWDRVASWDARYRLVADTALALALALLTVPLSTDVWFSASPGWVAPAATLGMCAALVARRTRPAASAAAVYAVALLHMMTGALLVVPGDVLVLVALYSVTLHGPRWAYRTAIAGALVGTGLHGLLMVLQAGSYALASAAVLTVVMALMSVTVFAVALVIRSRRSSLDGLRERAARLEAERDRQMTEAAAAERARIAREMHDIVAHSLSVIIAQADGGRYAAAQDPAAAGRALTTVAETGRAALGDMRRLLGVLRTDGGPGRSESLPPGPAGAGAPPGTGPGSATGSAASGGPDARHGAAGTAGAGDAPDGDVPALRPQPGIGDLDQLVEQVRSGGPRVSLVRMGTQRLLPPGTGLAVYRIAQESLTNVLKHGGPDVTVTVLLQWRPSSLVLEVSDDGRGAGAQSDGAGQGLLGMRERATMLGGRLAAGPRAGGGYRVRAEIPLPLHRPHEEPA